MKVLLVKIAGTPVPRIRQRIVQVRSPGSWSGNLTSTELAGSQSEEDRLKHEAGRGRDGTSPHFGAPIPIWCAGHIWERAIANLNLSFQNGCRDQSNTLNTLREAAGMLETDLVL